MKKENIPGDSDFRNDTSGIDRIGKVNVFHTPDGYFEKFPVNLTDRIHAVPSHRSFITSTWYILAAAAMVALIAGVLYVVNYTNEKTFEPQLTSEELINSGVLAEMDEFMLVEALEVDHSDETEALQRDTISGNAGFEDYLIENNTDITLIINEL